MKRVQRKNSGIRQRKQLKLSLTRPLKPLLTQASLLHAQKQQEKQQQLFQKEQSLINNGDSSRFQKDLNFEFSHTHFPQSSKLDADVSDFASSEILSQDFFCTPDYITPECQNFLNTLDGDKENISCPSSPEKLKTVKNKI